MLLKVFKRKGVKRTFLSLIVILSLSFGLSNNAFATTVATNSVSYKSFAFFIPTETGIRTYAAVVGYRINVGYNRDNVKTTTDTTTLLIYLTDWYGAGTFATPDVIAVSPVTYYSGSTQLGTQSISTDTDPTFISGSWIGYDCKDTDSDCIYYYLALTAEGTVMVFQSDAGSYKTATISTTF